LHGLQIASLNREFETNIYHLQNTQSPAFIASDLFFDFNSFKIKNSFKKYLLLLVDQIKQNKESTIEIFGKALFITPAPFPTKLPIVENNSLNFLICFIFI
jgi:hypothetical protein